MKKTHLKKNTTKLPLPYKVRKGFSIYCAIVLVVALMLKQDKEKYTVPRSVHDYGVCRK